MVVGQHMSQLPGCKSGCAIGVAPDILGCWLRLVVNWAMGVCYLGTIWVLVA